MRRSVTLVLVSFAVVGAAWIAPTAMHYFLEDGPASFSLPAVSPEPAALLLWGGTLVAAGLGVRRRAARKAGRR